MFAETKKRPTFATLLKESAVLKSTGEMAEWSIAAVLKTVELRGSGGSNPSLSANNYKSLIIERLSGFFFEGCSISNPQTKMEVFN